MKRIRWSDTALSDYDEQINYIALQNRTNAGLVADRIENAVANLQDMPTGRKGRVAGTFEKIVHRTRLIIAYRFEANGDTTILRIIHGARRWREGQWP